MGTPVSVKIQAAIHLIQTFFYGTCKWFVAVIFMSTITAVFEECRNVKTISSYAIEDFYIFLILSFTKAHSACICMKLVQNTFCAVPYFIGVYCREVKVFFLFDNCLSQKVQNFSFISYLGTFIQIPGEVYFTSQIKIYGGDFPAYTSHLLLLRTCHFHEDRLHDIIPQRVHFNSLTH